MHGAGKNPNKLYPSVATEFAVVLSDSFTELSITPVKVGSINAPTNNVSHIILYTVNLTVLKGIGRANKIPIMERMSKHRNDYGELYPPRDENPIPPRITPINGAVRHVNAKK